MSRKQFIVYHPSQLNNLSPLPLAHRAGLGKIVLEQSFDHPGKEQWEKELNKYYYACGCSTSAKALLIGLLAFGIAAAIGYTSRDWTLSKTLVTFFGGAIAMAVVGKWIGLINAHSKLKHTVREIQMVWHPKWPTSKILGCG